MAFRTWVILLGLVSRAEVLISPNDELPMLSWQSSARMHALIRSYSQNLLANARSGRPLGDWAEYVCAENMKNTTPKANRRCRPRTSRISEPESSQPFLVLRRQHVYRSFRGGRPGQCRGGPSVDAYI